MIVDTRASAIFKLSLPMLLSMVLEQLIGLTDVIFLGRVSEVSVGAAALGGIAFFTIVMIASGYGIASQSQMGLANGAKNYPHIGELFVQTNLFFVGLLALLALTLPFCTQWLFEVAIQSPDVRSEAQSYFIWRTVGIGFAFAAIAFRSFFMAILRPKVLTYSSVVMVASNCVLNYFLIFGIGPFPALGIAGAAIASTLAEFFTLIFFIVYAYVTGCPDRYGIFRFTGWNKKLQTLLFKLGRYMMLQEAVVMVSWLLFFVWVEHMGERALAISNIVRSVANLLFIIVHAFGATCGSIGANLLGENRAHEIDSMMLRGLKLSACVTLPVLAFFAIFPEPILMCFTNITSLQTESIDSIRVMLASFLLCLPAYHYFTVFGFLGATRQSMIISFIAIFAYTIYSYVVTRIATDVAYVWTADIFYYAVILACVYYFWQRMDWRGLIRKKVK